MNCLDLNDFTTRAEATRDRLGVNLNDGVTDQKKPQCQGSFGIGKEAACLLGKPIFLREFLE